MRLFEWILSLVFAMCAVLGLVLCIALTLSVRYPVVTDTEDFYPPPPPEEEVAFNTASAYMRQNFLGVFYVSNYDGDTFVINLKDLPPIFSQKIGVRIAGIDAPEIKSDSPCEKEAAIKARDRLTAIIQSAKSIDLINAKRDKYFRIVADVHYDGIPIKDTLTTEGLVVPYSGGVRPKVDWCNKAK